MKAYRSSGLGGYRAPYGKRLLLLPYYLEKTGRRHVFYDVEPESFSDIAGDTQKIVDHVVANTRPGSIILLHVMYSKATLEAVPEIINRLRRQGFAFATVSELMARGK